MILLPAFARVHLGRLCGSRIGGTEIEDDRSARHLCLNLEQ